MPRHLALAALLAAALAAPAHAQFRSPQVPVIGTALQDLLGAQGQAITVATDQRLATGFSGLYITRPATHFFVRSFGGPDDALAVFDMLDPSPTPALTMIAPAALPGGWFTEVLFTDFPMQMIVNVFDASSVLQSTTTHPGFGFSFLGLATSGPGGVFYPYDERNPGQRAQVLAFLATGDVQGGTWLCGENRTEAGGGDFDFADAVFLLEQLNVTPVRHTTWGTLKQRFR